MSSPMDRESEVSAIVKRNAVPADVPAPLRQSQEEATRGWLRKLWDSVRGYTASDAARLKEAGVQVVEGEAALRVNQAKKLEAEAHKIHAEAEAIKQRAAIDAMMAQLDVAQKLSDGDVERAENYAAAVERYEAAISRIRQQGGDVAFDGEQLQRLLEAGERKAAEK